MKKGMKYDFNYEKLPNETRKLVGLDREPTRTAAGRAISSLTKNAGKVARVARLRLLKRIEQLENKLDKPSLYASGLEDYIRYVVREELGSTTKQKRSKK